jgi:hypothetical protein
VGESDQWHEGPQREIHDKLYTYLKALETRQLYRERENVTNLGLYEDREIMGVAPGLYVRPANATSRSRISLNVTGALCDTAVNHIAQTKPMAMALTEGGDWSQQRRAKDLNHFLEGQYYSLSIFDRMQESFHDASWAGTGIIYVDRDGAEPIVERVFPNELIVDDALCEYTPPFEMTRRKYVPRDKLLRLFGKRFGEEIRKAKPVKLDSIRGVNGNVELIPVYTTWRLPLDEKSPGKRVIIIETATLQVEPYKKKYFPFVFMRWRRQPVGFWGRGIPSLGESLQRSINKDANILSRSVALCSVPRLLLPTGSGINTEHLTNEIGSGIWYNGQAPSWMQGQAIPPEGLAHLQFTIGQYYQLIGISELAAGMKKPAGLNSGEAQRVYADNQADRFALPSQGYENASVEIAKRLIDVARDIAEEFGDYAVVHQTTKGFHRIKWSSIDLAEDEFVLKLWPINYLSKSPADMIDQINDLIKMGMLSEKQAKRLIPFPDLEGVMKQENAAEDLTQKIIEEIVEHSNYIAPDPVMDLKEAVKTVQLATLHYQALGCPDEILDMLRTWAANAQALIPVEPPPTPAGGSPTGIAGLPPPAPGMAAPPALAAG